MFYVAGEYRSVVAAFPQEFKDADRLTRICQVYDTTDHTVTVSGAGNDEITPKSQNPWLSGRMKTKNTPMMTTS